jgi:tight adherence protein B
MIAMRKCLAGVATVVAGVLALAGAAQAASAGGLEIISADAAAYPTVSAVVATPPDVAAGAEAFEVLEAGSPVAATVERLPTADLEVMLLLDTSGSMAGAPLESEKAAANEFLSVLPPEVRAGVVAYGTTPTLLAAPTTDRQATGAAISTLVADTDTALYDAVIFAGDQFTPDADRRALVLLTDGEDNVSHATIDEAEAVAAGLPVHVIELLTDRSDRPALDRLAAPGGGTVTTATDPAALSDLYRHAAGTVANQYRVSYTSGGSGPVDLTVRVRTGEAALTASTTIGLPAASPAPTTTPPAPTTAPQPPPTAPATPAAAAPGVRPLVDEAPRDTGSNVGLLVGAGAIFVSMLLTAAVLLRRDGGRRAIRSGLGLERARAAGTGIVKLKERTTTGVDRFLERRGRSRSASGALEAAGISLRPGEFVMLVLTATAVGGLAMLALFGALGLLATMVLGPLTAKVVLGRRCSGRRAKFAEQLAGNLQLLTSSLKSGYGLLPALDNVAQEAEEPSKSEFRRALLEIRVGRDVSEALAALGTRMASKDFEWVVGAIDINREVGGDLALTLDNVAETIRERQRLARHVNALTAEGRLSAYVLTGLPVFAGLAMSAINPGYLEPLFSGVGVVLLAVGSGMLLTGWVWMKRLIRVEL